MVRDLGQRAIFRWRLVGLRRDAKSEHRADMVAATQIDADRLSRDENGADGNARGARCPGFGGIFEDEALLVRFVRQELPAAAYPGGLYDCARARGNQLLRQAGHLSLHPGHAHAAHRGADGSHLRPGEEPELAGFLSVAHHSRDSQLRSAYS